jgi:acetylornithine aminotransferase/acetylornithine/N-succinyldiaminopimelate aminotransferase
MNESCKQPIQANAAADIIQSYQKYVVPSYGRFELALDHGAGSYVWDVQGKRYLDMGSGIAVCCLGHAPKAITETLTAQSQQLIHVSNLYYHELQARLAQAIVERIGPGKCFFCNSGAEANEGFYKLARKFGHDEGRFEIITALNSFHGRTLAGIAATGQDKVKKGFEPMVAGFRHVPFNDLTAVQEAISPATTAILIEGIQGEGGITPANPEYLLGLRKLCDEKRLLLLMDGVQCGYYRSGRFQSFQRILEGHPEATGFLPDGISMAKSIAGGFPMGAFWLRQPYADLLSPGTHASTFGGTPLACSVALKILQVIELENLSQNAREKGEFLKSGLLRLADKYPGLITMVRGLGLMLGFELSSQIPAFAGVEKPASLQFMHRLHAAGMLCVPAGQQVIRFLPPLNLRQSEAEEALQTLETILSSLAS